MPNMKSFDLIQFCCRASVSVLMILGVFLVIHGYDTSSDQKVLKEGDEMVTLLGYALAFLSPVSISLITLMRSQAAKKADLPIMFYMFWQGIGMLIMVALGKKVKYYCL